jgi:uncharacterized protein (DUF1810 family)
MSHSAVGSLADPYDLERFVDAQDPVYPLVLEELHNGCKTGHWIWFVFPQVRGLGFSSTSQRFSIGSRQEAQAYLVHPVLGPRLRGCTQLVLEVEGKSIQQIFGSPDDMKFRSSMTLFAHATSDKELFLKALDKYYDGKFDPLTLERI